MKISFIRNFQKRLLKFSWKHLWWSFLLSKVASLSVEFYWKDIIVYVFLWIWQKFSDQLFYSIPSNGMLLYFYSIFWSMFIAILEKGFLFAIKWISILKMQ